MKILYTCDNNYIWMMSISMISLFEIHKNENDLDVYLIGENISKENKEKLKSIAQKYGRECYIYDLPELNLPQEIITKRWPRSAFTRLFAAEILPKNIDKILYLDCDTIIKSSLSNLFFNKMDSVFLGVKDCISKRYKKNIGLSANSIYINAGVLLINLKKLREFNIYQKIESFLDKYKRYVNYADQDVLNGVFSNNIGALDAGYNVMTIEFVYTYNDILKLRRPTNYYTNDEINAAIKEPIIIHYTTNMTIIRPWFKDSNHPQKNDFLEIMKNNNFFNVELKESNQISAKDKILSLLLKLPKNIGFNILGLIHARLLPAFINLRGKI